MRMLKSCSLSTTVMPRRCDPQGRPGYLVITRIEEIYTEFCVPLRVQEHMVSVTAVAEQIAGSPTGAHLDVERLRRVLLLHDVGNLLKISPADMESMPLRRDGRRWQDIQAGFRGAFGEDASAMSLAAAEAAGLPVADLQLMQDMSFTHNERALLADDFELKVAAYADQRVAPHGVDSLLGRLRDAKARYRHCLNSIINTPRGEYMIECALEIEAQLMQEYSLDPEDITDSSVEPFRRRLRQAFAAGHCIGLD
jgi:hypothetical protein